MTTGFQIQCVTILRDGGVVNPDIENGNVFAQRGVQRPIRRILEGDIFEQHFAAVDESQHLGAQKLMGRLVVLQFEALVFPQLFHQFFARHGFAIRPPSVTVPIHHAAGLEQSLPITVTQFSPFDRPPRITAAINDSIAGDGHVFQVLAGNRRRRIHLFFAFQVNHHQWIEFAVAGKFQQRAAFQMQVDVAAQMNRASEPDARRDDQFATAFCRQRRDGLCKNPGVQCCAVAHTTKIGDICHRRRNHRGSDPW
jgi:hypothetical protein